MRVFGLLTFLLSYPLWSSTEITTQIYDIDYGTETGDEVLLLLTSGHVAKIHHSNKYLLSESVNMRLKKKKKKKKWYKVTLDDDRYITQLEKVEVPFSLKKMLSIPEHNLINQTYIPTTIESMDLAIKYFRSARYNPKESQCFNRAHIWSYEWWKKHGLRSNKIIIFFTRNYIRRYNFEWWWHIAPVVNIMENRKVVERVMDRKYTSGPRDVVTWKNIFLRNDADCPMIKKYSEYADNPYSGECMLYRTHMYTYQAADLQMYEAWNYQKNSWLMNEVRQAYLEAFDETI